MRSVQVLTGAGAFDRKQLVAKKPIDDYELLDRVADGDKLAIQVLFSRHKVRVFHFVRRTVKDEALAERDFGASLEF